MTDNRLSSVWSLQKYNKQITKERRQEKAILNWITPLKPKWTNNTTNGSLETEEVASKCKYAYLVGQWI